MQLIITGTVFATLNETVETIVVNLTENAQLDIKHHAIGDFTTVTVNGETWHFEENSLSFSMETANEVS